ncbi:MAG: S41 family peptidase [Pseudomonadota bacterium]
MNGERSTRTRFLIAGCVFGLAACSGGGSDSSPAPIPPAVVQTPSVQTPSYTVDVFEPADQFENRCENPRTGVDIEGNAFPDLDGSLSEELFWLRSWTEETYLWNDLLTDQDPNLFTDRLSYFDVLRTDETTASGEDLDDFHFSEPTEDFLERRQSAPSASYGVSYIAFSTTVPRDFRVQYTEPNSPASDDTSGLANFIRGARILEVDGVDLVNGGATQEEIDILNAGLFPATAGEIHTFVVQDPGATDSRTVTLTSENLSDTAVNRTAILNTPTGDVGYILFNTFSPFDSEEQIADAMAQMSAAGVTDLVLDLRYNGGGLLAVASQLAYMVAGDARTSGRTFEQLEFNANAGNRNPVTGEINDPIPFYDQALGFSLAAGTQLASLDLGRVFVLSTSDTCSASEAVINGLRGIGVEVVLIGDTTCGKPYGFYPTDNCGETYYTIQFRGVNDAGFGDYSDGFVPANSSFAFGERAPGCVVADDLNTELGDPAEGLLAAALQYREDGSCPALPQSSQTFALQRLDGSSGTVATTAITPPEAVLRTNRDMRLPQ